MESALKQMRMMWAFFIVACLAYVALPELLRAPVKPVQPMVYWVLMAIAFMDLVTIVIFRRFTIDKAADILRLNPSDAPAILKWRQGQLVTFAIASAIVLFGLVMRFVGINTLQAAPFYVVGVAALIIFKPQGVQ